MHIRSHSSMLPAILATKVRPGKARRPTMTILAARMKTLRPRIATVLAALALLVAAVLQTATATTIFPARDSEGFVRDGSPAPKDGRADFVFTSTGAQVLNVDGGTYPFEDRGVFEFDLSPAPPVGDARLALFKAGAHGPFPFNIDVYSYQGNGMIDKGDFNAGSLVASFDYNNQDQVDIDVTSLLQTAVANKTQFLGFNFRFNPASNIDLNSPSVVFSTSSSGVRPARLIINEPISAVPEPAPAALFGLGLLGVALLLRRRQGREATRFEESSR